MTMTSESRVFSANIGQAEAGTNGLPARLFRCCNLFRPTDQSDIAEDFNHDPLDIAMCR